MKSANKLYLPQCHVTVKKIMQTIKSIAQPGPALAYGKINQDNQTESSIPCFLTSVSKLCYTQAAKTRQCPSIHLENREISVFKNSRNVREMKFDCLYDYSIDHVSSSRSRFRSKLRLSILNLNSNIQKKDLKLLTCLFLLQERVVLRQNYL